MVCIRGRATSVAGVEQPGAELDKTRCHTRHRSAIQMSAANTSHDEYGIAHSPRYMDPRSSRG